MREITPLVFTITALGLSIFLSSCGKNAHERVPLAGTIQADNPAAIALYQKALNQQSAGKNNRALKTYYDVYKNYPHSPQAADAMFNRAALQQNKGDLLESFETYQIFIARYPGNGKYATALAQQAKVAHAAADGLIMNNFVGLKTRIDPVKTVKMLERVIKNAPRAKSAAKAQFAIAEVWQERRDSKKAIAGYEEIVREYSKSSYAPEAQFRIGSILATQSEKGNRDQANIQSARIAFQDVVNLYPGTKQAKLAKAQLAKLHTQDVANSLQVAKFYEGKGNLESARFYYKEVMQKSKSGALFNEAKSRLASIGG